MDFLLTAHRDVAAARRFFERAIARHEVPEKITIDKSGANTAAVRGLLADRVPKLDSLTKRQVVRTDGASVRP